MRRAQHCARLISMRLDLSGATSDRRSFRYVPHADALALHTAYIEKFWASSVSMYDFLVPGYPKKAEL